MNLLDGKLYIVAHVLNFLEPFKKQPKYTYYFLFSSLFTCTTQFAYKTYNSALLFILQYPQI